MENEQGLRILHLASSDRWTGVAEPATSVALLQKRRGCTVWMACIPGYTFEQRLSEQGIDSVKSVPLKRRFNPFKLIADIRALRSFVETNRVDVVHCHLLHDHWLAAFALRGLARRPILVRTVHRYETMRRDPVHRMIFEKALDLVITVSSEQRDLILHAYPKLTRRTELIHGGVNPDRFRPDLPGAGSVRADMGEKSNAPVAGIVAHLGYNRGHNWLMQAVPEVVNAVPNCSIWIVGQGEIFKDLRRRVLEPKYCDRVVLAGYRTDDLPETYAAMNVALLLGLGSEGSARAVLEAMSSGKPVIGVAKGALLDTITHGKDGLLVQENNVKELAEAMIRLLGNPEQAAEMGRAARQTVLERFTESRREEQVYEACQRALSRRSK